MKMSDSYTSTGNGDVSLTPNGSTKMNGSSPSLLAASNDMSTSAIIRKKLMGFVGFANLPNQVHRKSVRKGFQFTAMVVGTWTVTVTRLTRSCSFTFQGNPDWVNPRSSIHCSTQPSILRRKRYPPAQKDHRQLLLRALALVSNPIYCFQPYRAHLSLVLLRH